jgi:glycosidase
MLFTLRGIPEIYYGTEILMKNFSNPDGLVRSDFPGGWKTDPVNKFTASGRTASENEAFAYVKKLANFRKNSSALQTGQLMQYVPENGLYVYFRYNHQQTIMVIVNTNEKEEKLDTKRFAERINGYQEAVNIITQESLKDIGTMTLPAKTTSIFELRK